MTELVIRGFASGYELEHLARLFFSRAPLRGAKSTRGPLVYARANGFRLVAALRGPDGALRLATARRAPTPGQPQEETEAAVKLELCRLLYDLLRDATGIRPPWGMLTGVRPVRLLRGSLAAGEGAARQKLQGVYDVSDEKYALAAGIEALQRPVLAANSPRSYSLYVSIPFCPTRCSYCSFVSRTIQREGHLVDEYLQKLEVELAHIAHLAAASGLVLETVYVGGGTPTALNPAQLEFLLKALEKHFRPTTTREYSVEAGRPDCTGPEKLALLKAYGVGRISINPQTLQNGVLKEIGRQHTAEDFARCFAQARAAGHRNINTDLIAGLPGDTAAGFADTLHGILALAPENVTVHTLTLKRASDLVIDGRDEVSVPGAMLAGAYPRLTGAGYRPYYLYRQKNTVDNLENTGWTRPEREGLYNIFIMEEAHTILAAGAGGSTKLVAGGGAVIKRLYNHKFPADYIQRHGELLDRKKGVTEFYARYLDPKAPG